MGNIESYLGIAFTLHADANTEQLAAFAEAFQFVNIGRFVVMSMAAGGSVADLFDLYDSGFGGVSGRR